MNILTFETEELQSGYLRISDYRAKHLRDILKVKPGQEVRVGEIGGMIGKASVIKVDQNTIDLGDISLDAISTQLEFDILLALPRPQTLKKICELAACYSVRSLTLISSAKVEKSYFSSSLLQEAKLREHLILGLQQGVKTHLPKVVVEKDFFYATNTLADSYTGQKIVADIRKSQALSKVIDKSSSILMAFGPEGGWSEEELDYFGKKNFISINLSNSVLRVENALCCGLSQYELIMGLGS